MSYVVVVESPAKAKTINKYLGNDYTVLASYGHVRDLPAKDGSVKPDQNFEMIYEIDPDSRKNISAIAKAVKGSDTLYLATDPDREGEAISWHVLESLKETKALKPGLNVKRIVFYEITKKAVTEAIENPRDIDMNLVNAQQARRALDYLVGFNLSPVLWRKLPGSRSAGRVQSVALRLICERDQEIEAFVSQEYWDIAAQMGTDAGAGFKARLTEFGGEKLEKFSIPNKENADRIVAALAGKSYRVKSVTPKQMRRNPYAPFSTSTLQIDASRKLGFGTKKIMTLAQKLYEGVALGGETVGLITYMRTDAISVSTDAIHKARDLIGKTYGPNYVPASPRMYKTKSKNAQEAHEAIRPTDLTRTPEQVAAYLEPDMLRLYDLIWKRMMASQMEAAVYDQVLAEIEPVDGGAMLRANGSVLKFDGFLTLYQEGKDDDEGDDESSARLPELNPGQNLTLRELLPEQHFTEPPPRYSEASLVKKLEELGIGRPSTYASIISVLLDRGYVKLDKKRFVAESLGRLVSAFLVSFFGRYVEYSFTAQMEDTLDDISNGDKDWRAELKRFWDEFIAKVNESKELSNTEVLESLDKVLEPFTFGIGEEAKKARSCPTCKTGRLSLKTGKFGAFLGCSNYPECNFTKPLISAAGDDAAGSANIEFPRTLGVDPATQLTVTLRKGPYGVYVQLGEEGKPKRSSLPKGVSADSVDLAKALSLLALPRDVGAHPETGKMITAGVGRFGPYLLHDAKYTSLKAEDDVLTIGINRAVTLIADKAKNARPGNELLRTIGAHPEDNAPIEIYKGRYGSYVKHGKTNATLPKGAEVETFTLEEAVAALAARKPASKGKAKAKPKAKAKTADKPAAKPKAKRKTA